MLTILVVKGGSKTESSGKGQTPLFLNKLGAKRKEI